MNIRFYTKVRNLSVWQSIIYLFTNFKWTRTITEYIQILPDEVGYEEATLEARCVIVDGVLKIKL